MEHGSGGRRKEVQGSIKSYQCDLVSTNERHELCENVAIGKAKINPRNERICIESGLSCKEEEVDGESGDVNSKLGSSYGRKEKVLGGLMRNS